MHRADRHIPMLWRLFSGRSPRSRRRPARRPLAGLATMLTVAVGVLAGCSGGSSSCGQPFREPLDANSLQHVIDAATAKYTTNPPTSGPHLFRVADSGVLDRELLPAEQVTLLEAGQVVIQYRDPSLADAARSLAANLVTIAPNSSLPKPVVATAWTYKLECQSVDTAALTKFVAAHRNVYNNAGK